MFRDMPCLACRPGTQEFPTQAHHITTRGARGGDTVENLMPLCARHHMEWHERTAEFVFSNLAVLSWLEWNGRQDIISRLESRRVRVPET